MNKQRLIHLIETYLNDRIQGAVDAGKVTDADRAQLEGMKIGMLAKAHAAEDKFFDGCYSAASNNEGDAMVRAMKGLAA